MQYFSQQPNESINRLIEEAILEAEEKGARVISLGLLNQGEELNRYGGLFVHKNPELKIKVVDGSSLAVAVLTNSIPAEQPKWSLEAFSLRLLMPLPLPYAKREFS